LLKQKSSFQTAREIIKNDGFGLSGLNRGLTSTLGRHGIWNMIYFGFYHNIKVYIPKTEVTTQLSKILIIIILF
jgi:solute carrier family 25 (mitochondrial 2-oxodicarboxylate transporter), member 21